MPKTELFGLQCRVPKYVLLGQLVAVPPRNRAAVQIERLAGGRDLAAARPPLLSDNYISPRECKNVIDVEHAIERRAATAVFDGVGGALLARVVPLLAQASTVYTYGYLGGRDVPLQLPTMRLQTKALTLRSFSNFASPTVRDPQSLDAAPRHIGELLALPHCKTPLGRTYTFEQIDEAMAAVGSGEGKPVLLPS